MTSVTLADRQVAVIIDALAQTRDALRAQGVATPTIDETLAKIVSLMSPSVGDMVLSVA